MSDMNEAERPWRDADWLQREYVEHRELHDRDLNVHHKTPFSEFGSENHADANSLDNLMAVCGPCHREVEEGGNGGAA